MQFVMSESTKVTKIRKRESTVTGSFASGSKKCNLI